MTNTEQRLTAIEKLLFETDQYRNSGGELPYKVYTALLTNDDVNVNPPTAIVLQNTLTGTPTYTYIDIGIYDVTCTGCYTSNKTWVIVGNTNINEEGQAWYTVSNISTDVIRLNSLNGTDGPSSTLKLTPIEIRVYQ